MRFISKLTMTVAAIFFALSVSAHAGGHDTTSNSLGSKIYQVCKKWRVDQGGPMPTDQMQHCRTVLFCITTRYSYDGGACVDEAMYGGGCIRPGCGCPSSNCVTSDVRADAKTELGYW